MSTDTFYLFETYVPFVFKYGYTTRTLNARLSDYIGVAKPKQLIGHFTVPNGRQTEQYFNEFLQTKNIPIVYKFGNEYFSYFNNASDLFNEFRGMKKNTNDKSTKQMEREIMKYLKEEAKKSKS